MSLSSIGYRDFEVVKFAHWGSTHYCPDCLASNSFAILFYSKDVFGNMEQVHEEHVLPFPKRTFQMLSTKQGEGLPK